jgi:hypothetical protein
LLESLGCCLSVIGVNLGSETALINAQGNNHLEVIADIDTQNNEIASQTEASTAPRTTSIEVIILKTQSMSPRACRGVTFFIKTLSIIQRY